MQAQQINNEEKLINNILFIYIFGVAISGFVFVMIFLNGGTREFIFLLSGLCAVITKLLEKPLGKNAKYVYACIPPVIISWRKTHRLAYGMKATYFLLDFHVE